MAEEFFGKLTPPVIDVYLGLKDSLSKCERKWGDGSFKDKEWKPWGNSEEHLAMLWMHGRKEEVRKIIRPLPEDIRHKGFFGPDQSLPMHEYITASKKTMKILELPTAHTRKSDETRSEELRELMNSRLTACERDAIYEWYVERWVSSAASNYGCNWMDAAWKAPVDAYDNVSSSMIKLVEGFSRLRQKPDPACVVPGGYLGESFRHRSTPELDVPFGIVRKECLFLTASSNCYPGEDGAKVEVVPRNNDGSIVQLHGYIGMAKNVVQFKGTENDPDGKECARLLDAFNEDPLTWLEKLDAAAPSKCIFCKRSKDECDGCIQACRRFLTEEGWLNPPTKTVYRDRAVKRQRMTEESDHDVLARESRQYREVFPKDESEEASVKAFFSLEDPEVVQVLLYWLRCKKAFVPVRAAEIINMCDKFEIDWSPLRKLTYRGVREKLSWSWVMKRLDARSKALEVAKGAEKADSPPTTTTTTQESQESEDDEDI